MNHRICLTAVLCVLSFYDTQGTSLPESPCPDMYDYEWSADNNMWCGIISLMTPPEFSRLNLDVKLSSPVPISSTDYGSLELKEKQQSLSRLAGKIVSQERTPLQYLVIFPKNKPIPKLISISINNDVLCESKVPDIHYSTISLSAKINTGLNVPLSRGADFKSDNNREKHTEQKDISTNHQTQTPVNTNNHMKAPEESVAVLPKEPEEKPFVFGSMDKERTTEAPVLENMKERNELLINILKNLMDTQLHLLTKNNERITQTNTKVVVQVNTYSYSA